MHITSVSDVKIHLSEYLDRLAITGEPIFITKNGKPAGVVVSMDEYEGWRETCEIMADSKLVQEIKDALAAHARGESKEYTIDELLGES